MALVRRMAVCDRTSDEFTYQDGELSSFQAVRFSNQELGFDQEMDQQVGVIFNLKQWKEMGSPDKVTISIETGNKLEDEHGH